MKRIIYLAIALACNWNAVFGQVISESGIMVFGQTGYVQSFAVGPMVSQQMDAVHLYEQFLNDEYDVKIGMKTRASGTFGFGVGYGLTDKLAVGTGLSFARSGFTFRANQYYKADAEDFEIYSLVQVKARARFVQMPLWIALCDTEGKWMLRSGVNLNFTNLDKSTLIETKEFELYRNGRLDGESHIPFTETPYSSLSYKSLVLGGFVEVNRKISNGLYAGLSGEYIGDYLDNGIGSVQCAVKLSYFLGI